MEWGVAQLAERLAVNQEVAGSSPAAPVLSIGPFHGARRLAFDREASYARLFNSKRSGYCASLTLRVG